MVKAVTAMGLAAVVLETSPHMALVPAEPRVPVLPEQLRPIKAEVEAAAVPGKQDRPQVPAVTDHPLT